ncbi:MAG TPA: threonylcarbamoyl-AMP synthase [Nitrospirae bacterium]|nr:threonylcarbamoyl-AMP synthase [Nitrospirota bacterium]
MEFNIALLRTVFQTMAIINIHNNNYSKVIDRAVSVVRNSGLLIYPTETFYALGARYDAKEAISRIFTVKVRTSEKTLPLIIGDLSQLELITTSISNEERIFIDKFWPGPLTILLNAKADLHEQISFNKKVAVRMTDNKVAQDISKYSGFPLISTSANISKMPASTSIDDLIPHFNDKVDLIIDAGFTKGGKPSTIVEITSQGVKILRLGAIEKDKILEAGLRILS